MEFLILINLLFVLFSTIIADKSVTWDRSKITVSVKPDVRRFELPQNDQLIRPHLHYKTHFGIIIKKNTTFTLKVKSRQKIQELYFHCLTSSAKETINEISLKGEKNSEKSVTTLADCVPLISVSHNVPVEVTVKTRNWTVLPIFDTRKVTYLTSQEAEKYFYAKLQTYGFVENFYTQMLISSKDVEKIKAANFSLYLGLQNQADLVQYYDYLTGASRFENENERSSYKLMERSTIFLRAEPCDTKFTKNSQKISKHDQYIIYDKCEHIGNSCKNRLSCNYYAYYSAYWVAIITDVSAFLHPQKGYDWVLLHEIGHNYNIAPNNAELVGLGNTMEVWNNIFGALYQHKFENLKEYWINSSSSEATDTISQYHSGVFLKNWDWRPKLHFFMSLFGLDGTDSAFREFHVRYYKRSETEFLYFNNIIPTLLEVFLDLHKINMLPYIRKIVDFNEYEIPLINEDLELRLLSVPSIMPAMDFDIEASDLRTASKERNFRNATPLVLLQKVPKKYVNVKFYISAPVILFGRCLYLNNNCHKIFGHMVKLQLLADVYSSYIVFKVGKKLYISDVGYHTLSKDMKVNIKVKEMREKDTFLPLTYYFLDAYGSSGFLFARTHINYKNKEIAVSQFTDEISDNSTDIYHSLTLKRNNRIVFEYVFSFQPENATKSLVNNLHKFEIGDVLHVYHREIERLKINGKILGVDCSSRNNTFVFTPVGIDNIKNEKNHDIIKSDLKRIYDYVNEYNIDLSYNVLLQHYLERYARNLDSFDSNIEFPSRWLSI